MAEAASLRWTRLDADRQRLRARVVDFRRRLDDDRQTLAEERERLVGPESWPANHPIATVAGAAAAGFIAGIAPAPRVDKVPVKAATTATSRGAALGLSAVKVEAGVIARDVVRAIFRGRDGDSSA